MLFDLCQFGTINQLDFEQSAFKASRRLPLALAAGTNIGIAPEVANSKADQGPLFRIIDTDTRFIERSEEHTSELQSLMRISYAVFCLKKKKTQTTKTEKQ